MKGIVFAVDVDFATNTTCRIANNENLDFSLQKKKKKRERRAGRKERSFFERETRKRELKKRVIKEMRL